MLPKSKVTLDKFNIFWYLDFRFQWNLGTQLIYNFSYIFLSVSRSCLFQSKSDFTIEMFILFRVTQNILIRWRELDFLKIFFVCFEICVNSYKCYRHIAYLEAPSEQSWSFHQCTDIDITKITFAYWKKYFSLHPQLFPA